MARTTDIYIANRTAWVRFNGRQGLIKRGYTTVRAGHPLYEQNKAAFDPFRVEFDVDSPAAAKASAKADPKPAPAAPVAPQVKDTTETRSQPDF